MKLKKIISLVVFLIGLVQFVYTQSNQTQYQYDNLNRLTQVVYTNGITIAYSYDELGNRTGKTITVVPNYDVYFTQQPTTSQDTAIIGDVLPIASVIGNRGNTSTTTAIDFYWSLDTLKDGSDIALSSNKTTTSLIPPLSNIQDTFMVTISANLNNMSGYILLILDENDNLSETDESNNKGVVAMKVTVIPVELLSFTGEKVPNGNLLKWITVSEINNKGFEVQRLYNGETFETIGFIEGQGTSLNIHSYDYLDANQNNKVVYYRLKQIDFDGTFEYSNIIVINGAEQFNESNIVVYPNPNTGKFELAFSNFERARYIIEIYNTAGQLIHFQEINLAGDKQLQYNLEHKAGLYYLRLYNAKAPHKRFMRSFIIQ